MGYLIIYFIISIYAITLTILLKKRIEEVIPISIVEIIFVVFLSGLFDHLEIGIKLIELGAILQLILIWLTIRKKEKEFIHRVLTPGFLVYSLLFLINVILNKDRILENYDEFNHWAVMVKNMFLYHSYTGEQSVVSFNEYPPFTAIFQYLFLMIQKVYREDIIIIAQNVLYFSLIIPITKQIKWDKRLIKLWIILPVIVFVPMIFYPNFYLEILVDGIIGVMFAYVISVALGKEENIKIKYIKILAGEIMLVLTKTSSIALAVLSILIMLIDKIIFGLKKNKTNTKKEIKAIVIICLIILVIVVMWYSKVIGAEKRWDFRKIIPIDTIQWEQIDKVAQNFLHQTFLEEQMTNRRFTVLSTTFLLICLAIYTLNKEQETRQKYYGIAMLISILIWLIGLCLMYMTIFEMHEAISLTCFERYVSTMLLANAIFYMFIIIQMEEKQSKKQTIIVILILLSMLPLATIQQKYIKGKNYIMMSRVNRNIYTQLKQYKNQLKETDKVLFIVEKKADIDYITSMNNYEIMPLTIEQSIKSSFNDVDSFTKKIENYTHVFIHGIESEEEKIIKEVFENEEIKTDRLYKVEK